MVQLWPLHTGSLLFKILHSKALRNFAMNITSSPHEDNFSQQPNKQEFNCDKINDKNRESCLTKKLLSNSSLRFGNTNLAQEKLQRLVEAGHTKLQVLADFDFTLSNFCLPDGSRADSTHALLENDKTRQLMQKYLPIEYDQTLSVEQKIPHMVQWWTESHQEIVDDKYNEEKLRNLVRNTKGLRLRSGFVEFFALLEKYDIPIVIFSGGIGDIIKIVIEEHLGKLPNNVHIISNWMIFDSQTNVVGFKNPIVHSFNKNGSVIKEENKEFFDNLRSRPNILLMGDSLGDASMDVGLETEQIVFRLGFLNFSAEKSLDDYLEAFDVICIKDESLDSAVTILSAVVGSQY